MATSTTRAHARARTMDDIIGAARRQLAEQGAAALSLRSVAREVGMVSSAVYRYVASRDELLTRLIIDAYDALGDAIDAAMAASRGEPPATRWVLVAHTIRDWAIAHPHEYALVFGSPVPGYAAPDTTVTPGTRAPLALVRIVAEAQETKQFTPPRRTAEQPIGDTLATELAALRDVVGGFAVSPDTVLDVLIGWTELFGLLSFELFNQTRGMVEHPRELFDASARRMAAAIGLH